VYDDPLALEVARAPLQHLVPRRFGFTYLTIHFDQFLWGSWVPGFHLTNLLLHSLCASLVAGCALALGARPFAASLCGLLFAVHPVHVEAVASIENRKDILAMMFVAGSVMLYRSRWRPRWCYPASLACFALGMHAKEVAAVGLAAMLPLTDLLPDSTSAVRSSARLRRAAGRAVPVLMLGLIVTGSAAGNIFEKFSVRSIAAETDGTVSSYDEVLATAAGSVPDVARLLFFPAKLSVDYPKRPQTSLTNRRASAGLLLTLSWIAVAALLARRAPVAAFSMVWTLVMYLPVSNVVPLTPFFVAERYLYVPSFGVCLTVALGIEALHRSLAGDGTKAWVRAAPIGLAAVLIVTGAMRSAVRNRDWRDGLSLWTSALRTVPEGSGKIHGELGLVLWELGRGNEAIRHLTRALDIGPEEADFHNNLALALLQARRPSEAIGHLRRALEMRPEEPLTRFNLARTLLEVGKADEALVHLRHVAREEAWHDVSPTTKAALAERGLSAAEFRVTIRRWLDDATSARTKRPGP
jgi:tetratricopeptide (TPR) repeat protein